MCGWDICTIFFRRIRLENYGCDYGMAGMREGGEPSQSAGHWFLSTALFIGSTSSLYFQYSEKRFAGQHEDRWTVLSVQVQTFDTYHGTASQRRHRHREACRLGWHSVVVFVFRADQVHQTLRQRFFNAIRMQVHDRESATRPDLLFFEFNLFVKELINSHKISRKTRRRKSLPFWIIIVSYNNLTLYRSGIFDKNIRCCRNCHDFVTSFFLRAPIRKKLLVHEIKISFPWRHFELKRFVPNRVCICYNGQ